MGDQKSAKNYRHYPERSCLQTVNCVTYPSSDPPMFHGLTIAYHIVQFLGSIAAYLDSSGFVRILSSKNNDLVEASRPAQFFNEPFFLFIRPHNEALYIM